jgi:DNA-binding NarL/FixJ family response regulator
MPIRTERAGSTSVLVVDDHGTLADLLTAHATQALLERAVTAGACCLLPKDASFQEVLSALRSAGRGGFVVHPALMRELMTGTRQVAQPAPQLTLRERDVLDLLADGHDARAIARALGISLHICWGHVRSLLTRLNAHSQLQAVANATRVGLVHGADPG